MPALRSPLASRAHVQPSQARSVPEAARRPRGRGGCVAHFLPKRDSLGYFPIRIESGVTSTNSPATMYSTASCRIGGGGGGGGGGRMEGGGRTPEGWAVWQRAKRASGRVWQRAKRARGRCGSAQRAEGPWVRASATRHPPPSAIRALLWGGDRCFRPGCDRCAFVRVRIADSGPIAALFGSNRCFRSGCERCAFVRVRIGGGAHLERELHRRSRRRRPRQAAPPPLPP